MFVYVFMIKDSDNGNNIDDNGDDDIHKDSVDNENETKHILTMVSIMKMVILLILI